MNCQIQKRKKNGLISFFCLLALLLMLSSCVRKKKYFNKLPIYYNQTSSTVKEDVEVRVRAYSPEESKAIFDVDLLAQGYQPLYLNINNNSPKEYIIRPGYIEQELIKSKKIAKLLHSNTSLFLYAAGTPALFFCWPLLPLLIVPKGYQMHKDNQKIDLLMRKNTLEAEDTVIVPAYSSINKLLFVPAAYYSSIFYIKLYDQEERKLLQFKVDTMTDQEEE